MSYNQQVSVFLQQANQIYIQRSTMVVRMNDLSKSLAYRREARECFLRLKDAYNDIKDALDNYGYAIIKNSSNGKLELIKVW